MYSPAFLNLKIGIWYFIQFYHKHESLKSIHLENYIKILYFMKYGFKTMRHHSIKKKLKKNNEEDWFVVILGRNWTWHIDGP